MRGWVCCFFFSACSFPPLGRCFAAPLSPREPFMPAFGLKIYYYFSFSMFVPNSFWAKTRFFFFRYVLAAARLFHSLNQEEPQSTAHKKIARECWKGYKQQYRLECLCCEYKRRIFSFFFSSPSKRNDEKCLGMSERRGPRKPSATIWGSINILAFILLRKLDFSGNY